MRFFIKSALPALAIGLFIVAGCGKKDSGTGPAQTSSVVGTWSAMQSGSGVSYVFNANTYAMTASLAGSPIATENGTYTVNGNQVVLTCSSLTAMGFAGTCGPAVTATVNGNQMSIPDSEGGSPTVVTKQ
jgi:hypothetical protein